MISESTQAKRTSAPVEIEISRALIVDKIAEILYTLNYVPHDKIVRDIIFKDTDTKQWTMSVSIRKEQGVLRSKHNGFNKTEA